MIPSYYSIGSNSYKSRVFTGFSQLQKDEEFTDLILAADGYIVHVHKNIIALASPYLKEILKSLHSQSPVVFLNNVSHKLLSYLLEYIYQGEVNVPTDAIQAFIQLSKSLHIIGIDGSFISNKGTQVDLTKPTAKTSDEGNIAAHISIGNDHTMQIQSYPQSGDSSSATVCDEISGAVELHSSIDVPRQEHDMTKIITQSDSMSPHEMDNLISRNYKSIKKIRRSKKLDIRKDKNKRPRNIRQSLRKTGEFQNIPVIEIQTDNTDVDEHLQTIDTRQYRGYKLNVKNPYDIEQERIQLINVASQDDQSLSFQVNNAIPVLEATAQYEIVTNEDPNNIQIQMVNEDQNNLYQDQSIQMNICNVDQINFNQALTLQDQNDINKLKDKPTIQILEEKIIKPPTISSTNTQFAPDAIEISMNAAEISRTIPNKEINSDATKHVPQYSTTERGLLQLILNGYVYNCHHTSQRGQKRRFRCIEYRRHSCRAMVDTFGETIVARFGLHDHPSHDVKINKKVKKGLIFDNIKQAVDTIDTEKMQKNY